MGSTSRLWDEGGYLKSVLVFMGKFKRFKKILNFCQNGHRNFCKITPIMDFEG